MSSIQFRRGIIAILVGFGSALLIGLTSGILNLSPTSYVAWFALYFPIGFILGFKVEDFHWASLIGVYLITFFIALVIDFSLAANGLDLSYEVLQFSAGLFLLLSGFVLARLLA